MKKIIHFFILLVISILFIACPPYEPPSEIVQIRIKNLTSDSLIIAFYIDDDTDDYHILYRPDWPIVLHSLPSSTSLLFETLRDNDIEISNFFEVVIKNKITAKRLIVIEELSKDTLAKWDDNSVVFTDQQYWMIEYGEDDSHNMGSFCTLNLTDEVLKLE